jgi:hypothetical protein
MFGSGRSHHRWSLRMLRRWGVGCRVGYGGDRGVNPSAKVVEIAIRRTDVVSGMRQIPEDILKLFEIVNERLPGGRRAGTTRGDVVNIGEDAIGVELWDLTGDTEEGVHTEGWSHRGHRGNYGKDEMRGK